MAWRTVSPPEYYRKLTDHRETFPFDFLAYLPQRHDVRNETDGNDWSRVLVWNQLLNQLHDQCVFISWIPSDLDRWLDLSQPPRTHELFGPRTIRLRASLSPYGASELQRLVLADDALAYLEFVVYGRFPVAHRMEYLQRFDLDDYPIAKQWDHFRSTLDRDYVVQLRREFESVGPALLK